MPHSGASVTDLATRRRSDDVLSTMSFVFGGVHYGTIPIATPYTKGKPIVLYIVPHVPDSSPDLFTGPIDCLITDDAALAADLDVAR